MSKDIGKHHHEEVSKMGLPEWMQNLICPYCEEKLPLKSIRMVGVKFNTRNLGDTVVEFACDKCMKMDTIYYRKDSVNINEFEKLLSGEKKPEADPVLEEDMYRSGYNNVVELMVRGGE